jgi:hypothetical protein
MNRILLFAITAVTLMSAAGAASAQRIILDFGPGYGPPPPGYGPNYARPVRTIAATAVAEAGTTGPAVSELGTAASRAGLCRTVSANPTGAISSVPRPRDGRTSSAVVVINW